LTPAAFLPRHNIGNALFALGKFEEAEIWFRRALALKPNSAESHNNLGNIYHDQRRLEEAALSYEAAIKADPQFVAAYRNLGNVREEQQYLDEARRSYRTASDLDADVPLRQLRSITMCPTVFSSVEEIHEYRQQLMFDITRFSQLDVRVDLSTLAAVADAPPFNLMYHGQDDQAIKEAYANLFSRHLPQIVHHPTTGKPRIGFVVTGGHEHAFVRCMGPVIEHLDIDHYEIVVLCFPRSLEAIRSRIQRDDLQFVPIDKRLDAATQTIREARLHILYYWEVGSDTTNYFLPHLRLAPVQCTSWGVPVTSGVPTLDYYISSELLEIVPNQRPYTEQLITLKSLPTLQRCYVAADGARARAELAFDDDQHVYLCAQNLAKIHPDFDPILGDILRRDRAAVAVFIEDRQRYCASRLEQRLRRTITDVRHQIRFVAAQPRDKYLSLLAASNVVLDTVHYGGAMTTYDTLSQGSPLVTLPGNSQRSQYAAACYRQMGLDECVAANDEAYVSIANRLGTEPDYRNDVSAKVAQTRDRLFDDKNVIRSYEEIFDVLIAEVEHNN
jgi:predicted O-linked N-acetylglucosamine transferase (SPINDLY family)